MVEPLIALVLILIFIVILLLIRFSSKLKEISMDQETVKGAVTTCWKELGVDQDIGAIKEKAADSQTATQTQKIKKKVIINGKIKKIITTTINRPASEQQ